MDLKIRRTLLGRSFALLAVGLLVGALGTAAALSLDVWAPAKQSVFTSGIEESDFALEEFRTFVKGKDRIDVRLTLANADSVPHEANVTVQLLDAAGAVLVEETRQVGSLAGGDSARETWRFEAPGLVAGFEETFVIVEQTS